MHRREGAEGVSISSIFLKVGVPSGAVNLTERTISVRRCAGKRRSQRRGHLDDLIFSPVNYMESCRFGMLEPKDPLKNL